MALVRDFALRDLDDARLDLDRALPRFFGGADLLRAFQALARHQQVGSERIDVRASVRATIRAGGLVRLERGTRPQLPEYLVWVDRISPRDHLPALADDLIGQLARSHIHATRYDFRGAPSRFRRHHGAGAAGATEIVELGSFLGTAPQRRLLIVSDGNGLFPTFSDRPWRWLHALLQFASVTLLTPKPVERWGPREEALAILGFGVVPLTPEGIAALARNLEGEPRAGLEINGTGGRDPALALRQRFARWLEPEPPERAEIDAMVDRLQAWLGPEAFELLAATAIYPEISPNLTRLLGGLLAESGAERHAAPLDEARFGAVARLLWLREGRMPDWLRAALLARLAPERQRRLRAALEVALLESGERGALSVEIASQSRWTLFEVLLTLLRDRDARASHDHVFLQFLRGERAGRVEFEVGRPLRRRLRPQLALAEWLILASAALIALVLPWLEDETGFLSAALEQAATRFASLSQAPLTLMLGCGLGGLALLAGGQFARRLIPLAQGALAVAAALASSLALATGLSLYIAGAATLAASLVLAWILDTVRRDPRIRPFARLFEGDRWALSTVSLAAPLLGIVVLEALFANLVIDGTSISADRWLAAIAYLGPAIWLTAAVLALLAKPRMSGSTAHLLRLATIFVLAEVAVDGVFILVLQGGLFLPWLLPLALNGQRVAMEVWGGARQVGGLIAVALALHRMGLIATRSIAGLAAAGLVATLAVALLPPSMPYLQAVPVWVAGIVVVACLLGRLPAADALRADRLAGAVTIGAIPLAAGALVHSGFQEPPPTSATATALALLSLWPTARCSYPDLWRPRRCTSTNYAWSTTGSRWVWALVPVLWLFFCLGYGFGPANIGLDYLLMPVAAWLGARHGETGWRVLTVGTLRLLVLIGIGGLTIGADPPALFIALQVVCRLFGQRSYRLDCLRADWITKRQLAYLFVVLAVYADWVGAFGAADLTLAIHFGLYINFIFLMLGLSNIRLRAFVLPFFCIAVLSYLVGSFSTAYIFPRIAGFVVGLICSGHRSLADVSTSFPLQCLLMYFIGTVLRARIARAQTLPMSTIALLALLTLLVYASSGLTVSYAITTDDGTQFLPALEFGTSLGGAALLFVAGVAGGGHGALLAVAAWCLVNLGIPIAILGPDPGSWGSGDVSVGGEWVFMPGVGLIDPYDSQPPYDPAAWGEVSVSTHVGTSLVGTNIGLAPGWTLGPLDLLFA